MNRPTQIEEGEWYYKGCFIQKQSYPSLLKYHVFKDNESQDTISTCSTMSYAILLCNDNEVLNSVHTINDFI